MTTTRTMLNGIPAAPNKPSAMPDRCSGRFESRLVYFNLLRDSLPEQIVTESRRYLDEQLQATDQLTCDLPDKIDAIASWIDDRADQVRRQYREYLDARQAGAARRFFSNKSHALYFLKSVAPTKIVDGAWLYGLTRRWNDARFSSLIKIYLEELGEGVPNKNHVVIYKKLLATHGCEQWDNLSDDHYVQGTIQLSLAHHANHFLPEVIGFNLGYEQPPLHLLITAYELNELGIDPTYFTLHFTIDNASTGHAKKSLEGLLDSLPRVGDADAFFRRVIRGYKLNSLGICTNSVIASFDIYKELIAILAKKSAAGQQVHSDYCRVGGRTVNEWLSDPAQIPDFLASLEERGWIKRDQDPQNSRFWKLIQGDKAEMFGVFNLYEKQVIYDWIAGEPREADVAQSSDGKIGGAAFPQRRLTFKATQRSLDTLGQRSESTRHNAAARGVIRHHSPHGGTGADNNDFNIELRMLEEKLTSLSSREEVMNLLTALMSPHNHHTEAGLMATRIFTRMVG